MQKTDFFPGPKRQLRLQRYEGFAVTDTERALTFYFDMPLTAESMQGAPPCVSAAFEHVAKLENCMPRLPLDTKFEGVGIKFYETPESQNDGELGFAATTVKKLVVRRPAGEQEERAEDISLRFAVSVPRGKRIAEWADEHVGGDVFASFTVTQPALDFEGKVEEAEAEHESESPDDDMPLLPQEQAEAVAGVKSEELSENWGVNERKHRRNRERTHA